MGLVICARRNGECVAERAGPSRPGASMPVSQMCQPTGRTVMSYRFSVLVAALASSLHAAVPAMAQATDTPNGAIAAAPGNKPAQKQVDQPPPAAAVAAPATPVAPVAATGTVTVQTPAAPAPAAAPAAVTPPAVVALPSPVATPAPVAAPASAAAASATAAVADPAPAASPAPPAAVAAPATGPAAPAPSVAATEASTTCLNPKSTLNRRVTSCTAMLGEPGRPVTDQVQALRWWLSRSSKLTRWSNPSRPWPVPCCSRPARRAGR